MLTASLSEATLAMAAPVIKTQIHLLLYPFPAPGHIIPLLNLTHRLLTRGLSITLLVTPSNLPLLDSLFASYPSSLQHLLLPLPSPSPASENGLIAIMRALRDSHSPAILQWFRSHPSPPVAIVSDPFLGWTHQLAGLLGIKRLVFSPSGAYAVSVNNSLWRDLPQVHDPNDLDALISLPDLPGRPIYPWWQISPTYRAYKDGDPDSQFYRDCVFANMASWGFVLNSFTELERVYLDHLKNEMGHDRVWAVGPLLPPIDDSAEPVMTWLDAHVDGSVIYVCFGSRIVLTRAEMESLTEALERSGVHFILCVRSPGDGHVAEDDDDIGEIPDGFKDRVAGRGLLMNEWAPQVAILRHRAVGSFLTHCGWNSVLEGLSGGAVMVTWPMDADQFINAKLLVDEVRVGVRVGEEATQKTPDSAALARLLSECVDQSGRLEKVRLRVKEMNDAAVGAVQVGGSSGKEFDDLVNTLSELANETNDGGC